MFKTDRLCIRPIVPEDFAACTDTRKGAELRPNELNGGVLAIGMRSQRSFDQLVARRDTMMTWDQAYYFGVFCKVSGSFVGEVMLFNVIRGIHHNAEIGGIFYVPFRKQGFAREALRALILHGFRKLRLHRIEGLADPGNVVSLKMCADIGLRVECISPRRVKSGGRWRDTVMLGITREEI
jgi:RimJ/RimL family protein N-acetyltransferase